MSSRSTKVLTKNPTRPFERRITPPCDRKPNCHIQNCVLSLDSSTANGSLDDHEAGGVVLASRPGHLLLQLGGPVHLDQCGTALVGDQRIGPIGG